MRPETEWKICMERNVFCLSCACAYLIASHGIFLLTGIHIPIRITHLSNVVCSSDTAKVFIPVVSDGLGPDPSLSPSSLALKSWSTENNSYSASSKQRSSWAIIRAAAVFFCTDSHKGDRRQSLNEVFGCEMKGMFHASDRHGKKKEKDMERGKLSRYITEDMLGTHCK